MLFQVPYWRGDFLFSYCVLSYANVHWNLQNNLIQWVLSVYFWDEEPKAQRSEIACPRTHSRKAEAGWVVPTLFALFSIVVGLFAYSHPLSARLHPASRAGNKRLGSCRNEQTEDTRRQFPMLVGTSKPQQGSDLIEENGGGVVLGHHLQPGRSTLLFGETTETPDKRVRSQPCHLLEKKPSYAEALRMGQGQKGVLRASRP